MFYANSSYSYASNTLYLVRNQEVSFRMKVSVLDEIHKCSALTVCCTVLRTERKEQTSTLNCNHTPYHYGRT
jgi:hypothetical protein